MIRKKTNAKFISDAEPSGVNPTEDIILNWLKEFGELINESNNCTCKDSTGWTEMPCCNICGKQVKT